ncbi:paraquat-inducible protein B [Inquilinus ginsengisoli]|uniref:Paraquat-inducible protein B n=1 Tax=Inquilinus ginsengisoli TaxID=363840 RepID=A0ABU1JZK8_9PROT|nr:MlaD family protein [Inquilinus ginsengisoli]MDR6294066.1 paraquat-inducible protein B [Inquilinus ginsengisoli]
MTETSGLPPAAPRIDRKRRLSPIWLIPIVAVLIAGYLGWITFSSQGPTITISFQAADGLEAGKTLIKHKEVVFGTVKTIALSEDLSHVEVTAEMTQAAAPHLNQDTRFWVVRPRLSASGGLTGFSTIVSGSYIELDPGKGESRRSFTGLEDPPVVRADVPGTEFLLKADRIGSVGPGSPIFYRDVQVGQVMGFDADNLANGVTIHAFVRAPFDSQVRAKTNFWNASGISIGAGAQGLKIQLESLTAVLAGGIAFDTPDVGSAGEQAKAGTTFTLYKDQASVEEAEYTVRLPYLLYFDGSVGGLEPGANVEWRGIKVGRVSEVRLQYDAAQNRMRIPVLVELEPQRIEMVGAKPGLGPKEYTDQVKALVGRGLRAQLKNGNLLTGQLIVTLDIFPDTYQQTVGEGDRYPILPTVQGQFDSVMRSASAILDKISALPIDQLVDQTNATLKTLQSLAASPEITESLRSLAGALSSTQQLLGQANTNLGPTLQQLPPLLAAAQQAVRRLGGTLGSDGYGADSGFKRDLTRLMGQVEDTLRSIRVLTDYLEQHPEALIRGKTEGLN